MRYDLIIRNANLVSPEKIIQGDIGVSGGKISKTGKLENGDTADEVYDAQGKYIFPGIIDAHVHFRDPGLTEKEDFETGSLAAAFGGVTCAADMPNTVPVTSTLESFNEKVSIAKSKSYIDFALFALLPNDEIETEKLYKGGALGFKVFLGTSTGDIAAPESGILFERLSQCAKLGARVGFHAETSEINSRCTDDCKEKSQRIDANEEGMKKGEGQLLAEARPVISETSAIQTAIRIAKNTGAKIHIHHVTSLDGACLVQEAKQNGIKVSAETCPHYLLFDSSLRPAKKVFPPIREKIHQKGLWEAIGTGVIDMIASDHAPHTAAQKALSFWEAPGGLCGVETLVPLMLNEAAKGNITLQHIALLLSEAPAKIWGIYPQKGTLQSGADADFTIVDMNKKWKIAADTLHSKSKTSPYEGIEVHGSVECTIVRGKFIVKDRILSSGKGYGILVSPAVFNRVF